MHEAAADRAAGADRQVPDPPHRVGEHREAGERVARSRRVVGDQRAERQRSVVGHPVIAGSGAAAEVDQRDGRASRNVIIGSRLWPPASSFGLLACRGEVGEQPDDVGDVVRAVVGEAAGFIPGALGAGRGRGVRHVGGDAVELAGGLRRAHPHEDHGTDDEQAEQGERQRQAEHGPEHAAEQQRGEAGDHAARGPRAGSWRQSTRSEMCLGVEQEAAAFAKFLLSATGEFCFALFGAWVAERHT